MSALSSLGQPITAGLVVEPDNVGGSDGWSNVGETANVTGGVWRQAINARDPKYRLRDGG